jgi:hypothetical protein
MDSKQKTSCPKSTEAERSEERRKSGHIIVLLKTILSNLRPGSLILCFFD